MRLKGFACLWLAPVTQQPIHTHEREEQGCARAWLPPLPLCSECTGHRGALRNHKGTRGTPVLSMSSGLGSPNATADQEAMHTCTEPSWGLWGCHPDLTPVQSQASTCQPTQQPPRAYGDLSVSTRTHDPPLREASKNPRGLPPPQQPALGSSGPQSWVPESCPVISMQGSHTVG